MMKILVTGMAGSGKTTASKTLCELGYDAYDIEDIDGMFAMYRKDTGERYDDYDNADPEKVKNADWLCDVTKLKEFLGQQSKELAFYCGVASNMDDIIPLFDKVLMLQADPGTLLTRLASREGTDDYGNTEDGRQSILGYKDWWEDEMTDKGVRIVDANGDPHEVAQKIILATN